MVIGVFIGLILGFLLAMSGFVASNTKAHVGSLRIDSSDPDGPFLFVELSRSIEAVYGMKYVVLDLKTHE
jgi:hypothetical protein